MSISSTIPCSLIRPCFSVLSECLRINSPRPSLNTFTWTRCTWTMSHPSAFLHTDSPPPPFRALPPRFQRTPLSTWRQPPNSARVPSEPEPSALTVAAVRTAFIFIFFGDTQCFFLAFDRRSNLKSHIETHNPYRKRPFVCPESDCKYPFTRSNDLKRHLVSKHGDQAK